LPRASTATSFCPRPLDFPKFPLVKQAARFLYSTAKVTEFAS
jgi:hypothetical protein